MCATNTVKPHLLHFFVLSNMKCSIFMCDTRGCLGTRIVVLSGTPLLLFTFIHKQAYYIYIYIMAINPKIHDPRRVVSLVQR